MKIDDAKKWKAEISQKLTDMLRDFEADTDIVVEDLYVIREREVIGGPQPPPVSRVIINVRL